VDLLLVLQFKLFLLICTSLRTVRLNSCLHELAVAMNDGRPLAVKLLPGFLQPHNLLLNPLGEPIHTLDAAHMPGRLADQIFGQPRLLHLLQALAAVALIVTQPPWRYHQSLILQQLAGLIQVLAQCQRRVYLCFLRPAEVAVAICGTHCHHPG